MTNGRNGIFFLLPMLTHDPCVISKKFQFILNDGEAITRRRVSFFFQRQLFNLKLHDPSFHNINLRRERVNFNT